MKDLKLQRLQLLGMLNLIDMIENSQSAIDNKVDDSDFWQKTHTQCVEKYQEQVAEFIIENQDAVKNTSVWSKLKNAFK